MDIDDEEYTRDLKLKSIISMNIERWFLSTNAKDIGTCATWAFAYVLSVIWYTDLDITSIIFSDIICLLYSIGVQLANNHCIAIADVERGIDGRLSFLNNSIKSRWHGYYKKLETYRSPWVGPYVLSRISRRKISNLKANGGGSDPNSCLQAEGHSNEESNLVTYAQEPKPVETIPLDNYTSGGRKDIAKELSDPNASTRKRGRNPHSSQELKIPNSQAKEGSVNSPALKQGSRSMVSNQNLRMLVTSQLEQYKNEDGKYNAIIRILADAGFLQYCYMLIKGKPGNMSKGITRETLDGITYEWFRNIAEELKTGKFKFTSARRVMIPKPGKKGEPPFRGRST